AYGKLILPSGDSLSPVLRVKTIQTIEDHKDNTNANIKALETCRWYSKGYRYPVFETVRNINVADSTVIFSTAFFYPPQEHLYLDTDPENQALLDDLWKDTEKKQTDVNTDQNQNAKTVTLEDIMTCKIYPNPVESQMYLEYELKEDAKVGFELYSIDGIPVRKLQPKAKTKGVIYNETIDCSA
ncbi:T9SS C-terminal target domain-containing protein, partial [Dysgonomonas sp. BGC7]|nr:T9SS C-terminal target domain-containing protein [Dysgonomonas sp. BGC7]